MNTSQDSSAEIHADIQDTRRRMDGTIGRLTERMRPRHLLDEFLHYVRTRRTWREGEAGRKASRAVEHVGNAAQHAGETVAHELRDNAVPVVLIAAGVSWWVWNRRHGNNGYSASELDDEFEQEEAIAGDGFQSDDGESRRDRLKDKASDVAERAKSAGRKLRRATVRGGHRIQDKSEEMMKKAGARARSGYCQGRERISDVADTHPLALAAGCLAMGVLGGLVMPRSRREDRWMGEASDEVTEQAKAAGHDLLERGKRVVSATASAVAEEAKEQGLAPDQLKEKIGHVAHDAAEAARASASDEGLQPNQLKEKAGSVLSEAKTAAEEQTKKQEPSDPNSPRTG